MGQADGVNLGDNARAATQAATRHKIEPEYIPLYVRLLGSEFEKLPAVLREFHKSGRKATGEFRVERGNGRTARALGVLLRMPAATDRAGVTLSVRPHAGRERWERVIGGRRFRTLQWARAQTLLERIGPFRVAFRLSVRGDSLVFGQTGLAVLGVPLPRLIAPRVSATAHGAADGWDIDVRIEAPMFGLLCRYSGRMTPA